MGPEAVPRQVLCEELSGTLVKPSKNEGGRYAIRNPSDVKPYDMTKARELHGMRSKLQAHGTRRGVPCRNLQNPCKTNTIQCVAQARHAEAARLGT